MVAHSAVLQGAALAGRAGSLPAGEGPIACKLCATVTGDTFYQPGWLPQTKFDDGIHETVLWYPTRRERWEDRLKCHYPNDHWQMCDNRS